MANLTDTGESRGLRFLLGQSGATAPVLPLQLALTTTVPTDSAAGTEVVGGSYARQDITFATESGGASTNTGDIVFEDMPAVGGSGVRGFEIWDSAGTPIRWWHGVPSVERTVAAGDDYKVADGDLDVSLA